jgi:c-di-AMP phosphodiesterase-like protein
MEKLCTNKIHSYKHNEQINKQNIDNSDSLGVKYVKIHSKLYRTYLETGMYLIYFFDLMQIGTQTQLFLSIDTQIFDNCANKQKETTTLK